MQVIYELRSRELTKLIRAMQRSGHPFLHTEGNKMANAIRDAGEAAMPARLCVEAEDPEEE